MLEVVDDLQTFSCALSGANAIYNKRKAFMLA